MRSLHSQKQAVPTIKSLPAENSQQRIFFSIENRTGQDNNSTFAFRFFFNFDQFPSLCKHQCRTHGLVCNEQIVNNVLTGLLTKSNQTCAVPWSLILSGALPANYLQHDKKASLFSVTKLSMISKNYDEWFNFSRDPCVLKSLMY